MDGVFIYVLIAVFIIFIMVILVRRMKFKIHVDILIKNGSCHIDGKMKWWRLTFFKKSGKLDLSLHDKELRFFSQDQQSGTSENDDTEFSWETLKMASKSMVSMLNNVEKIAFHTKIRAGCYEPEHTAMTAALFYLIQHTVIPYIKHRHQALDVSLQIEPEFQHPEFSLQIQSMILLLPGQAIRIIRGMNQARRDGLK